MGCNSGWIKCSDRLPEHGVKVVAYYRNAMGKERRVMACYFERFKEESNMEECNDEYHEGTDTYYIKEGWYEMVDNWDDYDSFVIYQGIVTHWQPLPDPPKEERIKEKKIKVIRSLAGEDMKHSLGIEGIELDEEDQDDK